MTLKASDALRLLENDITPIRAVLDAVAGNASLLNSGMNVISGGMVSMAFQAIRVRVDPSGVRPCVAETRAQQANNTHSQREIH